MSKIIKPLKPLYPRQEHGGIDPALFRHPPAIYRGTPFWSWNNVLQSDQLLRQIHILKAMGMGGFHMHVRAGMATPYLGDEFMALVEQCVEEARREGLLAWLYDEDRWPSGAAGGLVTRDPAYRARHLLFTPWRYGEKETASSLDSSARAKRAGNGTLIARYWIRLHDGTLADYRRLHYDEANPADGTIWYAYLETALPSPWFNNQTYVDTLNPEAIRRFIDVTYERYAECVGSSFGTTIPAIFTDEPQFPHKEALATPEELRDLILPCTYDLFTTYAEIYQQRLEDVLPEVIWDLPNKQPSVARYRYHDHVCERFTRAFADQIGAWCAAHRLHLTGHMMEEPTLASQTAALGEAMRAYRSFQLPGIDMLCDRHEYTTAKQAQSAARQYGREGVLSELYGVTNWDFDFVGHKAQGDWQAALGVTVRVPHLAWVSMAGEAKRDYPASINYQSPWWREYPLIEDHFARVNTAMTRGSAIAHVGVIHPIESYWLCSGPLEQTRDERQVLEKNFTTITEWLLFGLIDFDFIAESLLPELCSHPATTPLQVGASAYNVIVVPGLRTLRRSTLERLQAFRAAGGRVIFAGEIPGLIDAQISDEVQRFAQECECIALAKDDILTAVAAEREFDAILPDGTRATTLLYQLRADGPDRYLFCCNVDRSQAMNGLRLHLRGEWQVTLLDTLTGEMQNTATTYHSGGTRVLWDMQAHGSLLLQLTPGRTASSVPVRRVIWQAGQRWPDEVEVTFSEPNVLLLDRAAYCLDSGQRFPETEILRLDNLLRQDLGWPLRMKALAQPWTQPAIPPSHTAQLRFTINTDIAVANPLLALENASQVRLMLDGQPVATTITGWFVDEAIHTVPLPTLTPGQHVLELIIPYGPATNLEWCYLLGDFGVQVQGTAARLVSLHHTLKFGDWSRQGLPFYAGNVTYHMHITGTNKQYALHVPNYRSPLLAVDLDGQRAGTIAFAPFQLDLGVLAPGEHHIAVTAYGNRANTFGPLHNAQEKVWMIPNAWRTEGEAWADDYRLTPIGIMAPPEMLFREYRE